MKILGFIGNIVKRAVTGEGKSLLGVKNSSNEYDLIAAGALAVRVLIAVFIIWISKVMGIPYEQIIEATNQLAE